MGVAVVACIVLLLGTACSSDSRSAKPLSYDEALGVLQEARRLAERRDAAGLCGLTGSGPEASRCRWIADSLEGVELGIPEVVGHRATTGDGETQLPAVVFELCVDVNGRSLYTEFYVVRMPNGRLDAPHPSYWEARTIVMHRGGPIASFADPDAGPKDRRCT
jgi:hypothetical protein